MSRFYQAFSLYTATAVSNLLGKAAAGVSESLWSSVLRLAVIAVCYLTLKGFFSCFTKKREAFSKQELRFSLGTHIIDDLVSFFENTLKHLTRELAGHRKSVLIVSHCDGFDSIADNVIVVGAESRS